MARHHVPGFSESESPMATKGHLPGSVIFISPASAAADMPSVMPLAVFPSAKIERDGLAGLADDVAGRHHDAVLADDHAAAGGAADLNAHHRRQHLVHHRLDLRFQRLESGQVLGLLDHGRARGRQRWLNQGPAKEAAPSPKRPRATEERRGKLRESHCGTMLRRGASMCGDVYRVARALAEQPFSMIGAAGENASAQAPFLAACSTAYHRV